MERTIRVMEKVNGGLGKFGVKFSSCLCQETGLEDYLVDNLKLVALVGHVGVY